MINRFRTRLAERLCPHVFTQARRYQYLDQQVRDLRDWCGHEFEDVGSAASWLLARVFNHFQGQESPAVQGGEPIELFRQRLRSRRDRKVVQLQRRGGLQ